MEGATSASRHSDSPVTPESSSVLGRPKGIAGSSSGKALRAMQLYRQQLIRMFLRARGVDPDAAYPTGWLGSTAG
jgi:hypothetical protein